MLRTQVLGQIGWDNALLITADNGQGLLRLLLDCGSQTLDTVPLSEIQQIDHLLFSHLHMDHVAGFDAFFRVNFERVSKENHIWGPPDTAKIIAHRFQGYWWNHAPDIQGTWFVHDISAHSVQTFRFEAQEAFAVAHDMGSEAYSNVILQTPQVSVEVLPLQHQGLSLGYVLREPTRVNVNMAALSKLGLKGGPWLAQLKAGALGMLNINGVQHDAGELRAQLLQQESGQSAAYLTDFLLDEAELQRLAPLLDGVQQLYLEAQYAPEDTELAAKNHHTTALQGATLAKLSGVQKLTLLHLSRRYQPAQWGEMLHSARTIFPEAQFPEGWTSE